jgi:hypothetical protein
MRRVQTCVLSLSSVLLLAATGCGSAPEAGPGAAGGDVQERALLPSSVGRGAAPSSLVRIPGGRLVDASCAQRVARDEVVVGHGTIRSFDGTVRTVPPCANQAVVDDVAASSTSNPLHPDVQESENWTSPDMVGLLSADLTIPPSPAFDDDYVAFYIDLEHDSDGSGLIVQLMYVGPGSWAAEADYIESGSPPHYYSSEPLTGLSSGDHLHFTIQGLSASADCDSNGACKWVMTAEDETLGYSTSISTSLAVPYYWVWGGAMDASRITKCNQLPSSAVVFDDITIHKWGTDDVLTPSSWTASYDSGICGWTPSGKSATEVVLSP